MIYEYPEEFIVPIVYVDDFKDKYMYRDKNSNSLQEDKLSIPDKKLQSHGMFLADIDVYGKFKYEDINILNMEGEVLQGPDNEDILKESNVETISNIISDIDEEYANSETSGIYNNQY